jgi:type I restriction enzyme S subunit
MWADWLNTTIGDQVRLQRGIDITKAVQRAGCVPVVSSGGISSYHDTAYAKAPGVVLGRKGNVGTVFYLAEDYWPHDTSLWVTDFRGNDARFVYYFFLNFADELKTMDVGSANPALNRNHVHPLKTTWPQKEEQRAIARVLGALDDKIELNRRMNRTLEELAAALFRSWFVDFDPVVAKAAGRKPAHLRPDLAALFPATFQDSPLGPIPTGWAVGQLRDVTGFLPGYAFKSADWMEQGIPVVKIGSVKPGIVELSEVSFVSEQVANAAAKFQLKPGDLLIGMTGYVGEVGLVPPTDNPPLLNQRVGKFVLERDGTDSLGFLFCLTRSVDFKTAVETNSHGTAQANVSSEGILSVRTVVPPNSVRNSFNKICQPLLNQILHNHGESRTLAALRDTLLPKLLSGELRVKPVSASMEANT